jgi:hypothetical protein
VAVSDLLDQFLSVQPAAPISTVTSAGVIALVLVAWRRTWRITRQAVTIAHEGGHALLAVLTGRRLTGITLHSDTSGLTFTWGKERGLGATLSLAAGYTAPSLLGLGGAALLASGRLTMLLWLSTALTVAMLVMVRNVFGALSLLVLGAILFVVGWYATPGWQAAFAYTAVWFLLIGGVRPVFEVQGARRRGRAPWSDPDQLAGITGVPAGLWITFFLLVCVGSLAAAAVVLGVVSATGWQF